MTNILLLKKFHTTHISPHWQSKVMFYHEQEPLDLGRHGLSLSSVGGPDQTLQLFQTPFIAVFLCYNFSSR